MRSEAFSALGSPVDGRAALSYCTSVSMDGGIILPVGRTRVCTAQRLASRRWWRRQHHSTLTAHAGPSAVTQAEPHHRDQHHWHIKPLNSMPQCSRGSPACHQPSICARARRRALHASRRTASGGLPLAASALRRLQPSPHASGKRCRKPQGPPGSCPSQLPARSRAWDLQRI